MKHFKPRRSRRPPPAAAGQNADKCGESLTVAAPMKINLALHIIGKRADGYHELQSPVVFSARGDVLHFSAAARDSFSIEGAFAACLPRSRNNLVLRARDALRAAFGARAVPPAAIRLVKNLPVAAGLGGGSADAAAVLAGLSALNGLNAAEAGRGEEKPAPPRALMRLAAELGADVPMCLAWLYQKTAYLASGKGEVLQSLPHFPCLHLVVMNAGAPLSTRLVFSVLEARAGAPLPEAESWARPRGFAQWAAFLRGLRNDLYEPALRIMPELSEARQLLRESGAAFCAMSGSGASLFGLYPNQRTAETAADFIRARAPNSFVIAVKTDGAPAPA